MKKALTSLLIFCLSISTAFAASFKDVSNIHPNYVAITYLNSQGILNGYEDGGFKPDQSVNRAEALKIVSEGNKLKLPDTVTAEDIAAFKDVTIDDWFVKYLVAAKQAGIIGGNPDGTFTPERQVVKAEFIKMLLMANGFKAENWASQKVFKDVPQSAWFASYMNYAGQSGLVSPDDQNNLYPAKILTRGEVAEIMYLMIVIRSGKNTQFLLDQAEAQMNQIELYVNAKAIFTAKRASALSVDMTQQALKNMPDNMVVLGVAKLARAHDLLVDSYIAILEQKDEQAKDLAQQAIDKATEAWEANHELQSLARNIKDKANEILAQTNS